MATNYKYESINQEATVNGTNEAKEADPQNHQKWVFSAVVAAVVVAAGIFAIPRNPAATSVAPIAAISTNPNPPVSIPMPSGVNLGSWLSLEDYFYVGHNAIQVATPWGNTQGHCLPPLHTGQGPQWNSETDLLAHLVATTGSLVQAIRVFHAHRVTFITDDDLAQLEQLGIHHVRVPLSWCVTDANIEDLSKATAEQFVCEDPFFPGVQWPAIPKSFLQQFLRRCAAHGISATLDLHTYPGATSIGTFSGLWPRWPKFWWNDHPGSDQKDVGRQILADFVAWLEDMAEIDPVAFRGFRALSPMNEPAHLAGMFGADDPKAFVPALPDDIAADFLQTLPESVKDGPHLRIFLWLRDAASTFRDSKLPGLGKELHVNIHESVLSKSVLPKHVDSVVGAAQIIGSWWSAITSSSERASWAVLDMHHYHAWDDPCVGTSDGLGNYTCGDEVSRSITLKRCAAWATEVYRQAVDDTCGPGAKLASAEFSASTHHNVLRACNDIGTLHATYAAQVEAADAAGVELFFWSWKMPYGEAFRPAWSFKHLMYLLGVASKPDESNYPCGVPQAYNDAPTFP